MAERAAKSECICTTRRVCGAGCVGCHWLLCAAASSHMSPAPRCTITAPQRRVPRSREPSVVHDQRPFARRDIWRRANSSNLVTLDEPNMHESCFSGPAWLARGMTHDTLRRPFLVVRACLLVRCSRQGMKQSDSINGTARGAGPGGMIYSLEYL